MISYWLLSSIFFNARDHLKIKRRRPGFMYKSGRCANRNKVDKSRRHIIIPWPESLHCISGKACLGPKWNKSAHRDEGIFELEESVLIRAVISHPHSSSITISSIVDDCCCSSLSSVVVVQSPHRLTKKPPSTALRARAKARR